MKTLILSLGGSTIIPEKIDTKFLKEFRKLILDYSKDNRVVIVAGGGNICRIYQKASNDINHPDNATSELALDWIGIKATKLNAELVRSIFEKEAYEKIIDNPTQKIKTNKNIIIGSGWEPGCSSDLDAVLLAENFKADTLVNMTNVDYVYDKNPKEFKDAKPIKEMSWQDMKDLVGVKWVAGANVPFDPVATKKAAELGLKVIILSNNLKNFNEFLEGNEFKGTTIE